MASLPGLSDEAKLALARKRTSDIFNDLDKLIVVLVGWRDNAIDEETKRRYRYSARELEKSLERVETALERLQS